MNRTQFVLEQTIYIDKSLTILAFELGSITIAGPDSMSMFNIGAGKEVFIENLIFTHAQADSGATFYNSGNLSVENSKFLDFQALKGGVIYNESSSNLQLKNTVIKNVYALEGGAIWNAGKVNITKVFFSKSQAEVGGIIYNLDSVYVNSTTLSEGLADLGGAIYNQDYLNLHNSTFYSRFRRIGGAIYQASGNIIASSVTIAQNTADSTAGGLYVAENSYFTSTNTLIGANLANNYPDIYLGGNWNTDGFNLIGILSSDSLAGDSTDIIGTFVSPISPLLDSLRDHGGFAPTLALFPCSPAADRGYTEDSLDQRGFLRNTPADIGAFDGEIGIESPNAVTNTNREGPGSFRYTVEHANAGDTIRFDACLNGRKIYLGSQNISIDKSLTFIGDSINPPTLIAENIYQTMLSIDQNDSIYFYHLDFSVAQNYSSSRKFIQSRGTVVLDGCTISNYPTTRGGGIYASHLVINRSIFENINIHSFSDGLITGDSVLLEACTFQNNRVYSKMIQTNYNEHFKLKNCIIQNNYGEFLANDGNTEVIQCSFLNNQSGRRSIIYNTRKIVIDSSHFESNYERLNNGLLIDNRRNATVNNSKFEKNEYLNFGACIYSTDTLFVRGCEFSENKAIRSGGTIFKSGYSHIQHSDFIRNSSQEGSGAIYSSGETYIDSCNFIENHAPVGGAIDHDGFPSPNLLSVNYSKFYLNGTQDGNIISREGGAIRSEGSSVIDNCSFESNGAEKGSAIYVFYDVDDPLSSQIIQNSSFADHDSPGEGVIQVNTDLTINNSTIYHSRIPAINNESDIEAFIQNSTISRNTIGIQNSGNLRLQNTIVADNDDADIIQNGGTYYSNGYNLIGNIANTPFNSTSTDLIGSNQAPINPILANPSRNGFFTSTMALLPSSPAINTGNSGDELYDQRGLPRDAMPDIGAFEFAATNECIFAVWEVGDQLDCNDSTGFYKQQILIQYLNAPDSGSLFVELSNTAQTDTIELPIEANVINIEVDIPINSGNWNISGWFSDSVQCNFYQTDFFTALETCVQPEPVPLYRVNAGGIEMPDSLMNWDIDKQNNSSPFVNASASNNTTGWDGDQSVQNETGIPTKIFGTHRWDGPWGDEMKWSFPVPNGDYVVNVYFAEIKSNSASVGARVFDILAEGETVIDALDVFAEAGYKVALKKQLDISVSDGQLDIELQRMAGNPMISAIEVLGYEISERKVSTSDQFAIYPNPAKDILMIQSQHDGEASILIRNTLGQQVFSLKKKLEAKQQLNISALAKGIYYVEINTGKEIVSYQFVKD